MTRPRHSKKEIEAALAHAEAQGWRIELASGHAWGRLYCPHNDSECRCGEFCIVSVWSTPKNPANQQTKSHLTGQPARRAVVPLDK